ncbi:hypothetical protein [Tardisphaera saccharovorans]
MAEGANVTVSVYVPEHVRKALEAEVRAPPHEKGAGEGKRLSLRSYLRDLLARLISEEADGGLLSRERRMISYASREYSVPIDLPKEAYVRLRERASRARESVNVLASALLLNYSLRDPYVRREHASFFPQSAETARFVRDGDKSHLIRAHKGAGGGGAVNYVALGKIFYDSFLRLVADEEELKRVASLGSEDLRAWVQKYVDKLKGLVDEGMKVPTLRIENAELKTTLEALSSKNAQLRNALQSRDQDLKELKQEMNVKVKQLSDEKEDLQQRNSQLQEDNAELEQELKAEKERAEKLQGYMEEYEDAISLVLTARNDPLLGNILGNGALAWLMGTNPPEFMLVPNVAATADEVLKALEKSKFSSSTVNKEDLAHYAALVIMEHYARYLLRQRSSIISELAHLPSSTPCFLKASDHNFATKASNLVRNLEAFAWIWGGAAKKNARYSVKPLLPDSQKLLDAFDGMKARIEEAKKMLDECRPLGRR